MDLQVGAQGSGGSGVDVEEGVREVGVSVKCRRRLDYVVENGGMIRKDGELLKVVFCLGQMVVEGDGVVVVFAGHVTQESSDELLVE